MKTPYPMRWLKDILSVSPTSIMTGLKPKFLTIKKDSVNFAENNAMPTTIETERLLMRPLNMNDVDALYKLDSDPLVMKYLGNRPVKNLDEVNFYLKTILRQYELYDIGRWAVMEKSTGEMIGWAGLKYMNEETNGHIDFYDVGYRFRPEFWGKGYATEATNAWIDYAKKYLNIQTLYASAHIENIASQNVLKKCGFIEKGEYNFEMYGEHLACYWLELELV